MIGLGMAPKKILLTYSTEFVFLTIRVWNVVVVTIDMCGKFSIIGEWICGITWKHVYFNISVLFIVDNTSVLKLIFPTAYCFCLDGHLGGWVVAIAVLVSVVVVLLFYLLFRPLLLFFLLWLSSLVLLLLLVSSICVWLWLLLIQCLM